MAFLAPQSDPKETATPEMQQQQEQRLEELKMYSNFAGPFGMARAVPHAAIKLLGAVVSERVQTILAPTFVYELQMMFETPKGEAILRETLNGFAKPQIINQVAKPFVHMLQAGKSVLVKVNKEGETHNYSIPIGRVEAFAKELIGKVADAKRQAGGGQ